MTTLENHESDIRRILSNIGRMNNLQRMLCNSYARGSLLLAMSIESQTLSHKLQLMHERWQKHLPFLEASDVDFSYWSGELRRIGRAMAHPESDGGERSSQHIASPVFLIDLWEALPDHAGEMPSAGKLSSPDAYLQHRRTMHNDIKSHHTECLNRIFDYEVGQVVPDADSLWHQLTPQEQMQRCASAMQQLAEALMKIHVRLSQPIHKSEFRRLAERVFQEYGAQMQVEARDEVVQWQNVTPDDNLALEGETAVQLLLEDMRSGSVGALLTAHVRFDTDTENPELILEQQKERFGKFLFTNRRNLHLCDVQRLLRDHYLICEYRQRMDIIDEEEDDENRKEESTAALAPKTPIPQLQVPPLPPLPEFFCQNLRADKGATDCFLNILYDIEPLINATHRLAARDKEDGKRKEMPIYRWPHLKGALEKTGLMLHTTIQNFAWFMHQQFPDRSENSITRSFDRKRYDLETFDAIVADLTDRFQEVLKLFAK